MGNGTADRIRASALVVAAILGLSSGAARLAARQGPAKPENGRELFRTYCASCHGETGRGSGPAAAALRQRSPDLTQFAIRNGGVFPSARLTRVIDGRDVVAHGNPEMPVWGNAFRTSREHPTDDAVKARIDAIVKFLETIQVRRAE